MTAKTKGQIAAGVLLVLVLGYWLWPSSPVDEAISTLEELAESLEISGNESRLVRIGKGQRLQRGVTNPVDLNFREAGREGDWTSESLQSRYTAAALTAVSVTIDLLELSGEETGDGQVTITGRIKASYSGGGGPTNLDRKCRWIMTKSSGGDWQISSFRETEPEP